MNTALPRLPALPELALELASKPAYLCAVRELMLRVCQQLGFDDAQAGQIVLAIDEALANIMKHGYAGDEHGRIWLKVYAVVGDRRGPGVCCVLEDRAKQVEPASIKSRDLEDVRPGGLGVHIIRKVTDHAVYEQREGGGMRLTIVKYLSSPAVHESGEWCAGAGA